MSLFYKTIDDFENQIIVLEIFKKSFRANRDLNF